jgi:hypothetical protein
MENLKSCPFCGGRNLDSSFCGYGGAMGRPWLTGCLSCDIYMAATARAAKVKGFKSARALAEHKWNQRAEAIVSEASTIYK